MEVCMGGRWEGSRVAPVMGADMLSIPIAVSVVVVRCARLSFLFAYGSASSNLCTDPIYPQR